jgi:hypothetical protein
MKTPPPLRFTCDIRTLTITDTQTGEVIQCASTFEMAQRRRDLELKAMPVKPAYVRRQRVKEQW